MKVLLDEMLSAGVGGFLPDRQVTTVQNAGFKGLKNGELLRRAVASGYQVLLTADRNLPAQRTSRSAGSPSFNLSWRLVALWDGSFPGSAHVRDFGMTASDDEELWAFAREHGYVIVRRRTGPDLLAVRVTDERCAR